MIEYFVFLAEVLIELEYGSDVPTPVAVIWSTPYCYDCLVEHQLVAFHCELVSSGNEIYCVVVCEMLRDVGAE